MGLGLLGLMMLGAAAPSFPLPALLDDAGAARAFDYPALGEIRAKALADEARSAITRRHSGAAQGCRAPAEAWVEQGLAAVAGGRSAAWPDDRGHAEAALAQTLALRRTVLNGGQTGDADMDREMAAIQKDVADAPTPRARELERRVLSDQFSRRFDMGLNDRVAGALPPGARRLFDALFMAEVCADDDRNLAWVRDEIDRHGWFAISRDGKTADQDAWLLVQHADDDVAYQEKILALLETLKARGDTDAKNYAYLYDRVAVNRGRPQRYGTQGGCRDGQRFTAPLEDPEQVDALRQAVGLSTLADYNARFHCHKPSG